MTRISEVYEFSEQPLPEFLLAHELPEQADCQQFTRAVTKFMGSRGKHEVITLDGTVRRQKSTVWLEDGLVAAGLVEELDGNGEFEITGLEVNISAIDSSAAERAREFVVVLPFSTKQKGKYGFSQQLGIELDYEHFGDFPWYPYIEDMGVDKVPGDDEGWNTFMDILALRDDEIVETLKTDTGTLTADPEAAEIKQKAEGLMDELRVSGDWNKLVALSRARTEKKVKNIQRTFASKRIINGITNLLSEIAQND